MTDEKKKGSQKLNVGTLEKRPESMKIIYDKITNGKAFDMFKTNPTGKDSAKLEFINADIKKIFEKMNVEELKKLGQTKAGKPSPGTYLMFKEKGTETALKISALLKTCEFGGGAGSGGGASKTDKQEAMQCYYLSYLINNGIGEYTLENKNDVTINKDLASDKNLQYCHTPAFPNKTAVKELLSDGDLLDWLTHGKKGDDLNVFMKIANKIKDHMKKSPNFDFNPPYHIHHKSAFMNEVYKSREKVLEQDKKGDKKAPAGFNNDKWNPGDIWISKMAPATKVDEIFGKTHLGDGAIDFTKETNFEMLKQAVFKLAKDGKLLGVSLKKVADNANVKELNIPDKRKYNTNPKIINFTFGKGPKGTVDDFFSSNDIYLNFDNGEKMQLRSFDGEKSWQGEVKGSLAASGKIGGGGINYYTEKYLGKKIGGDSGGKWSEGPLRKPDFAPIYELYQKYASHNKNGNKIKSNEVIGDLNTFKSNVCAVKSHHSFMFSKYMGLLFLDTICTKDGFTTKNFQEFSTQMLRYAMSNVDESSYHLKVSND